MKLLISVFLLVISVQAHIIKPYESIQASGNVIDIVIVNDMLTLSTDKGTIESYKISTKERLMMVQFPMIKDFMGDDIYPKVFSTDYLKISKGTWLLYKELVVHVNFFLLIMDKKLN